MFLPSDATDQLEQKVTEFFINAKKNKPEWRDEQMEVIKKVRNPTGSWFWYRLMVLLMFYREVWPLVVSGLLQSFRRCR